MGGMGGKYYSSANVLFWDFFINLSASCRTVVLWKKWSVNNFFWEGSSSAATFLLGWSVGVKGGVFMCTFLGEAVHLPFC